MKLDRNIYPLGGGKYALLLMRKLREPNPEHGLEIRNAIDVLIKHGVLDFGDTPDTDFFVIRLKDKYASSALYAYAKEAMDDDPEYAGEIQMLASIADHHDNKQQPD